MTDKNSRIKRILFRSAHRGTKESDLILGPYALAYVETMDDASLDEFEAFLEEGDNDIWDWISNASAPANGRYAILIEKLRSLNQKHA